MTDDDQALAVAKFPDGSILVRYSKSREYWQIKPGASMYPGEHLSMTRAADRVVWGGGTVLQGVDGASRFYEAVREAKAEWAEENEE